MDNIKYSSINNIEVIKNSNYNSGNYHYRYGI